MKVLNLMPYDFQLKNNDSEYYLTYKISLLNNVL